MSHRVRKTERPSKALETKVTIHDLTLDSDDESSSTGQESKSSEICSTSRTSKTETSKRVSKDATESQAAKDKQINNTGKNEKESVSSKDKRAKKFKLSRTKKPKADLGDIFGGGSALDQTSDFAGGFTPYKALAEKKLSRQKRQASANTSQRSTKEAESQPEKSAAKPTKRNLSRSVKVVEKEKQTAQDRKASQKESLVQNEIGSLVQKRTDKTDTDRQNEGTKEIEKESRESTTDDEPSGNACHLCGEEFKEGHAEHTKVCLRNLFKRTSSNSSTSTRPDAQSKADKGSTDEDNYVFCQVCQDDITALSADGRTAHVNACIDGTSVSSASRDVTDDVKAGVSDERETCHICQRDITEFNSHRRLLHVNYCVDKAESERKEKEMALKKAREKVLDCPLCGKPLQTQASRRKHLKQCARDLQVNPGLLTERVKQQEEEYELQLAAGVLPPPVKVTKPRNSRKKPPRETGGIGIRPGTLDADTQLALALSTSLQEHRRSEAQAATGAPPSTPDQNPAKKDAFSVLMTPKPAKRARRGKKNKEPERVPELLLQSREDLQRHLATKMQHLLAQVGGEISITPPLRSTRLTNRSPNTLRERKFQIVKEAPWWTLTKLPKDPGPDADRASPGDADKENRHLAAFYVRQLMPPVTMTTGRPYKAKVKPPETSGGEQLRNQNDQLSKSLPSSNDSLMPTTQTAMVLAELATEAGNATLDFTALGTTILDQTTAAGRGRGHGESLPRGASSPHKDTESTPEEESTGFLSSKSGTDKQNESSEKKRLLQQLGTMVNNPLLSDLRLKVKDGSIQGHKFMFAVRCPHVLETIDDARVITLPDYDLSTVKGVLEFIYTGIRPKITPHVYSLATRWRLDELVQICQENLPDLHEQDEVDIANTSQARLDDILKKIWGSDYEESDSEDEAKQKVDIKEDAEMEEAFNYELTQRKQQGAKAELEEEDTASSGEEEEEEEGIDRFNMTAADVLNELAMMDEDDQGTASGEEVLALELETESSSAEDDIQNRGNISSKETTRTKENTQCQETQSQGVTQNQQFTHNVKVTQKQEVSQNLSFTQNKQYSQNQGISPSREIRDIRSSVDSMEIDEDEAFSPQTINSDTDADNVEAQETSAKSPLRNAGSGVNKHEPRLKPQTIYTDSADGNQSESSSHPDLPVARMENERIMNVLSSPQTIDSESDLDDEKAGEVSKNSKAVLDQEIKSTSSDRILITDSPASVREGTGRYQEISTPELFPASPNTPDTGGRDTEDKTPVSGDPSRTVRYDMSDDDLFEVGSHSSQEVCIHDKNPAKGSNSSDDEELDSRPASPVFESHTQSKRPQATKDLSAALSAGDGRLTCSLPMDDDNDADVEDEDEGMKVSQLSKYKRKRSATASPRAQMTPNPKKRPRVGSLANNAPPSKVEAAQKVAPEDGLSSRSHSPPLTPLTPHSPTLSSPPPSPPVHPSPLPHHSPCPSDSDRSNHPHQEQSNHPHQAREEFVISSDSDLDTAPIDLTQDRDDLEENDLGHGDLGQDDLECDNLDDLGVIEHIGSNSRRGSHSTPPYETGTLSGGEDHPAVLDNSPVYSPEAAGSVQDVWSDFDDAGYTEDFLLPASRGSQKSQTPKSQSSRSPTGTSHLPQPALDYDPPTDMDTDTSMLDPTTPRPARAMETPKQAVPKKRRRPAVPPSPFTPMAGYDQMVTPDLKKACQNVGVRPMPKKKMITMLKHIYQTTHQYETDSELEVSFDAGKPSGSGAEMSRGKPDHPAAAVGGPEDDDPPFSQAMSQASSKFDQGGGDLMEESFVGSQNPQSSPTSSPEKNPSKKLSLDQKREKIRSFILGNDELYLKILNYEPLEFDEFRQELKENVTTMGSDIVMDFLDEQNIQFTMRKRKEEKAARKRSPTKRGRGRGRGRGRRPAASQK